MTVKLNYKTYGRGEPVIILHGLFGSSRNWHTLAKQLADGYQVITVDLRNHGDSGHADSMTYREMAGDIVNLVDERGLEKTTVIGHSMGGKTAMVFAMLHRALLDRLIVLDVAPIDYGSRFEYLIDAMERLPLDELSSRGEADESLSREIPDTMLRQSLLQNLVRDNGRFRWRANLAAIKANLANVGGFPDLEGVAPWPGPALFVGGGDSKYIQPESHAVIEKYFPRAEIQMLPNAGHWLQMDQPGPLYERVAVFLQSVKRSS